MSNRKVSQTIARKQLRQIKDISLTSFTNGTVATFVNLGDSELIILEAPQNKPLTNREIATKYGKYLNS